MDPDSHVDSIDYTPSRSTWTIEKCSDIRRALSTRVANARRPGELPDDELAEMSWLYLAVIRVERLLRVHHRYSMPGPIPAWVMRHDHAH